MTKSAKALFLSHGGGPMPLLGDPGHQDMIDCLKSIAATITKPDAIVVVSAHWEEEIPTITSAAAPSLIYDYYGFPKESYEITYPCPGDPRLAARVHELLGDAGIESSLDESRGVDHGVFVPLKIMFPEADIPCVQLSLAASLDPSLHIEIGRALQVLSLENVLLIGSGFSFHNMKAFFQPEMPQSQELNYSFERWLQDTCSNAEYAEQDRKQQLVDWAQAPGARFCHPREEHLIPLHVCYGIAESASTECFELNILNRKSSMYLW